MPSLEGIKAMPKMFGEQGYATALIGKWHLGLDGESSHPLDAGFDYFYGTRGSNDWDGPGINYPDFKNSRKDEWKTPLYRGREQDGIIPQDEFTERYTKEAISFIDGSSGEDKPFFIYLSHNMPHVPLFPNEKFKGQSRGGIFGDVVEELDDSVGQIIDHLEEQGLLEDTLVIFTSDNGPWCMMREFGGTAHPLRGEKSTCWEGGERVPAIFHCPGQIKPQVKEDFISGLDLYATFAALLDVELEDGQATDSLDMGPVIFDGKPSPRKEYLFVHGEARSYISWPYKIHTATVERTRDPYDASIAAPVTYHDPPLLFNLENDMGERRDIAEENPDIVKRLKEELVSAEKSVLGGV